LLQYAAHALWARDAGCVLGDPLIKALKVVWLKPDHYLLAFADRRPASFSASIYCCRRHL
jgi:hypothetical protein